MRSLIVVVVVSRLCAYSQTDKLYLFIYLFIYVFLGPHTWHMEVPRLGIKLELQLLD